MEIILASNSPRRKEILTRAGFEFKVKIPNCEECNCAQFDYEIVKQNSLNKALAVQEENSLVIAADTVVILDSVCLVKPQNVFEAFLCLKKLSNRTHKVVTSHTLLKGKSGITRVSTSYVTFRRLSSFEIIKYIIQKKPLDKAGSYGIQDFLTPESVLKPPKTSFISKLEGSYYNVMGLDLELIRELIALFPCV